MTSPVERVSDVIEAGDHCLCGHSRSVHYGACRAKDEAGAWCCMCTGFALWELGTAGRGPATGTDLATVIVTAREDLRLETLRNDTLSRELAAARKEIGKLTDSVRDAGERFDVLSRELADARSQVAAEPMTDARWGRLVRLARVLRIASNVCEVFGRRLDVDEARTS